MKKTSFLFTSVSSISFILKLNLILLIKLALSRDSLFNIIFKEFVSLAGKDMIPYTSGMCKQENFLDYIVTGCSDYNVHFVNCEHGKVLNVHLNI